MLVKPTITEYPEYYRRYIDELPDTGILDLYKKQTDELLKLYNNFSDVKLLFRYKPEKWSIIEVLGHLLDSEIIMGFRCLTYARKDKSDLPMYDHDQYINSASFDNINSHLLIEHYTVVRSSNLYLFKSIGEEAWKEVGLAGGKEFTARTIPYIVTGHTQHHLNVLKERYL